jgi:hypothetical protein
MRNYHLKVAGLVLCLPLAFTSCTPKETQSLLLPASALGVVLAEETAHLAGARKQIVLITPDASWGPASTAEKSFKDALKKQGVAILAIKSVNVGDPMKSGQIGLKAADLLDAVQKSADIGAIVSFAGAPLVNPADASAFPAEHPPLLVVATASLGDLPGVPGDRMALGRMLDARMVQLAIVDGADPAAPKSAKADATHDLFHQNYLILREPGQK